MFALTPQIKRLLFKLHRWGGLILAAFILFYCVTGILLNHRKAFDYFIVKEHSKSTVEVSDTTGLESFLEKYKAQINRDDDPKVIRIRDDRTIEFLYGSHGKTTYVINPDRGTMEIIAKHPMQPLTWLNDLHKSSKTSSLWIWLTDLVAVVIMGITITGLLVVRYRRLELLLLIGGVVLLVVAGLLA